MLLDEIVVHSGWMLSPSLQRRWGHGRSGTARRGEAHELVILLVGKGDKMGASHCDLPGAFVRTSGANSPFAAPGSTTRSYSTNLPPADQSSAGCRSSSAPAPASARTPIVPAMLFVPRKSGAWSMNTCSAWSSIHCCNRADAEARAAVHPLEHHRFLFHRLHRAHLIRHGLPQTAP